MNTVNSLFEALISLMVRPFASLPAWVALVVISLIFGALAALAFRYTSNQKLLKTVSTRVSANLLAMRLFGDDVRVMFRTQRSLLGASAMRFLLAIPPMIVMVIPFTLVVTQLAMWYEFRPLQVGEKATLAVHTRPEDFARVAGIQPQVPAGIQLVGPVRSAAANTIYWDIRPTAAASGEFVWDLGTTKITKRVATTDSKSKLGRAIPKRPGGNFWDQVLYPAEPAFDAASPIQEISIAYPARVNHLFGHAVPWWLTFLLVSIVGALALKPFVKLQF